MVDQVKQYKTALKKCLRCCPGVRKRLIDKFSLSLTPFLEDNPSPTMEQVNAAFGPPSEMATLLMTEVTPQESACYRRGKALIRITAGVLLLLVFTFTIYVCCFKDTPVIIVNEYSFFN